MKILIMLCMFVLLNGCGWMNKAPTQSPTNNSNQNQTPNQNGNQSTGKTSTMKDMMSYFDEKKLEYSDAKDLEVMDVNAHEGKSFMYGGKPVYLYRMNIQDEKNKSWMKEIQNTGKVKISQNGQEQSYDALVNGEYLLVSETGTDLKDLSEMFKKYEMK